MHNAPSVTYPVGRSLFLGRLLLALWLGGAGAMAIGWRSGTAGGWRIALACAALFLAAGLARRFWRVMPTGVLQWDGHDWHGPHAATASLGVHLDLQRHLLVRLSVPSLPDQWLWLEASSDPLRWDDLRRAVYSRAMHDPQRDATNP